MATGPFSSSSIFNESSFRLPDDTVFYAIFSDASLSSGNAAEVSSFLQSLHLQIINSISTFTSNYIWQHEPFSLSLSSIPKSPCICSTHLPHLHGKLRFGDNLEDEWFTVFLLFHISKCFPSLSIRVWDTDGEFLLIEAAFHIPRWINPDNSLNRVFIRNGSLHIVPKLRLPDPNLFDSLKFLMDFDQESRASESVQLAVKKKISDYPGRAERNMHRARVRVPVSVAQVLKHEPCLISLAVEGFYDRDIDTMKFAAKMEKFLGRGREEELVCVSVKMSKAMFAQLMQQNFQAPKCYPMPNRTNASVHAEAELGMKIACGFEMIYQLRRQEGSEGKSKTWGAFKERLESNGYFEGLLPGSNEYGRLMQNVEEYYRNSELFSRTSNMMSAPVRRIDEILASSYSVENFKGPDVPPSDDDSWLYNGDDELNTALLERQKEMEISNSKFNKNQKSKDEQVDPSSSCSMDESDLGDISKSMQKFVKKLSSYQGVEVSDNREPEDVNLDVDRFIKEMESVMNHHTSMETATDAENEDESSSDLDFDESQDDESDYATDTINKDRENTFMESYSDTLDEELKSSTLKKSFYRASGETSQKNEGTSNATDHMEEDFTPVDVDVNLVKSFLDSFSSQEGLPGPASNLLGLMGIKLPRDGDKGK
ncbi:unnamed protein product [Citrullus colocynthis]|uniref:Protein ecdysoneless homolog n=1 Tax=Citrullus colocynthis TaxID=252529 RepID=A0ABP0YNQ0_9ROSI